jgi:hypothetical protein
MNSDNCTPSMQGQDTAINLILPTVYHAVWPGMELVNTTLITSAPDDADRDGL